MSRRSLLAGQLSGRPVAAPGQGRATGLPGGRPARRVIAVLLLGAAALDLSRCGVAVASARDAGPMAGLVMAGLAAAGLSLWTAHACGSRRRWPAWAALLIGAASGPQAAVSGFHPPYTIPDTATAALGILLAVAVLATAGRTRPTAPIGPFPAGSCTSITSTASITGIGSTTTSNTSASISNTSGSGSSSSNTSPVAANQRQRRQRQRRSGRGRV
jgi:hypothetical protein